MDVNEIVPQKDTPLTQFTAAMIATKGIIHHINNRRNGNWIDASENDNGQHNYVFDKNYFQKL